MFVVNLNILQKHYVIEQNICVLQEVPSWTVATVAALYWRLLGNASQTVACVQFAVSLAPSNSKDSPLHNIALLMFR